MFPQIAGLEIISNETETLPETGKSFLFDFEEGEFVFINGKMVEITGIEALKQWVNISLRTEKYRFNIYKDIEHGVRIEDLIGSNYGQAFIESEIKREVTESLLRHPLITAVQKWSFEKDRQKMITSFEIVSPLGESEVQYIV